MATTHPNVLKMSVQELRSAAAPRHPASPQTSAKDWALQVDRAAVLGTPPAVFQPHPGHLTRATRWLVEAAVIGFAAYGAGSFGRAARSLPRHRASPLMHRARATGPITVTRPDKPQSLNAPQGDLQSWISIMSAHFLLAHWGGPGNLGPMLTAARRLARRGHAIRILGSADAKAEVVACGFGFRAWSAEQTPPPHSDAETTAASLSDVATLCEHVMFGPAAA